jgi:hypothetical protein
MLNSVPTAAQKLKRPHFVYPVEQNYSLVPGSVLNVALRQANPLSLEGIFYQ